MARPRRESSDPVEQDLVGAATAGIIKDIEKEKKENNVIEFTSTGSDIFDLILGGGAAFGKMLNIVGNSSSGKSFFVSEIIASAKKKYKNKLKFVYLDCEAGYSFDSKAIWGFDIVSEDNPQVETVEGFAIEIEKTLNDMKKGEKLIYVIDSYDSLTSESESEEYDKKLDAIEKGKKAEGSYGMAKAKFINSFFRMMIRKIKEKDCLFIVVSQTRDNINSGLFGPKKQRAGGASIDFYSSQIIWLTIKEKFGRDDRPTGIGVEIKNTKNKLGVPHRKGIVDVIFNYGCDNVASNIKFLYDLHTPEGKVKDKVEGKNKDGKIIELYWGENKFKYRELIDYIEKNNLETELTEKVKQKWYELDKDVNFEGRKKRYE